jgi:hypothetical protein
MITMNLEELLFSFIILKGGNRFAFSLFYRR